MKVNKQFEELVEKELRLTLDRLKEVEHATGDITPDQVLSHLNGMAQRVAYSVSLDLWADEGE